jgi:hypothetical protein
MRAAALVTLVLCLSQPAFAQLAATPNAKGVAFVALGGTSTPNLDLDLVQLPGVYLVTFQRSK